MSARLIGLMTVLALLVGCTSATEHGRCIGLGGDKDPRLVYEPNVWNIFLGVVFIETIIVPVVVVAKEFSCPVAKKSEKP